MTETHQSPTNPATIAEEVRNHIDARMYSTPHKFITTDRLEEVWPSDDNRLKTFIPPEQHTPEHLKKVRTQYLLVLSTLVYIKLRIEVIQKALACFISDGRDDKDIPIREIPELEIVFRDLSSLDSSHIRHFYEDQFLFKPVRIVDNEEATKDVYEVHEKSIWPFTEKTRELGRGGYGTVYWVKVAKRCLEHRTPGRVESNNEDSDLAFKLFKRATDGQKELKKLNILKESISRQTRITVHLAMMIQQDDFYLFLPYTSLGDLEVFLQEGWNKSLTSSVLESQRYNFREAFNAFTSIDLFTELGNLADALVFLHYGLPREKFGKHCVHWDLRPRNILVFQGGQDDPVGQWKLTDFGISSFHRDQPKGDGPIMLTVGDVGRMVAGPSTDTASTRQGPGSYAYRAPELSESSSGKRPTKESDVWAFAAVATDVLAFASGEIPRGNGAAVEARGEGGAAAVEAARDLRMGHTTTDYKSDDFYETKPTLKLKASFTEWLKKVAESDVEDTHGLRSCAAIIHGTLQVEASARENAEWLVHRLRRIEKGTLQDSGNLSKYDFVKSWSGRSSPESRGNEPQGGGNRSDIEDEQSDYSQDINFTELRPLEPLDAPGASGGESTQTRVPETSTRDDRVRSPLKKRFTHFFGGNVSGNARASHTTPSKTTPLALSLDGTAACFLVTKDNGFRELQLFDISGEGPTCSALGEPHQTLQLPRDQQWKDPSLKIAGRYVVIDGALGSAFPFVLYDMQVKQAMDIPGQAVRDTYEVAPSARGIFAFWNDSVLKVWDSSATSERIWKTLHRDLDDIVHRAAFGQNGNSLHLWTRKTLKIWSIGEDGEFHDNETLPLEHDPARSKPFVLLPCTERSACLFEPSKIWRDLYDDFRPVLTSPRAADDGYLVYMRTTKQKSEVAAVPLDRRTSSEIYRHYPAREQPTRTWEVEGLFQAIALRPLQRDQRRIVLCNADKHIKMIDF